MPLSKPIAAFMEGVRAFLGDESGIALELQVQPELEPHAAKLLDAVAGEKDDLLVPVEASWSSPAELCVTIASTLEGVVQEALAVLGDEEHPLFAAPAAMSALPEVPVEVRLVEYAESVARAFSGHIRRLVFVLAIRGAEASGVEYGALLRRFCSVTGTPDLKWVNVSSRLFLEGQSIVQLRRGAHAVDERFSARSLERLVLDPAVRVETLRAGSAARAWARQHIEGHRVGNAPAIALLVEDISFEGRLFFFTEAARVLSRTCRDLEHRATGGKHVAALFEEAHELVGHRDAEVHFAEFCERLAKAMIAERGRLLVILAPHEGSAAVGLDESVRLLARSAASTRVRYLVIDSRLSPRLEDASSWAVWKLRFEIAAEQIERGMQERLASDDCSLAERLRYLSGLAAMAIAKDNPAAALEYSLAALELSASSERSEETTHAWYGLGNTLYQCAAFEPAERAYAECVDRALDEGSDRMAAQGMLGLGHSYFMRRMLPLAIDCYVTARTLWRRLRHPQGEIYALTWHAEAASLQSDVATAQSKFDDALRICDGADAAQADAYRAAKAELLLRKANLYGKARMQSEQQRCWTEAQELGATSPPSEHP